MMKTFKILLPLCLLALMVGCGNPGKSPLVGKKNEILSIWRLDKLDDKSFSKSWDDFSELLSVDDFRDLGPLGNLEDLFDDLAKQKVAVAYLARNKTGGYFAFDVSSCNKKQKEEVEDILKDFCKEKENMKFYDTDRGFYYVGPSDSEFKKSVHNAEFRNWKKEECWGLIQQSFNEPVSATYLDGERSIVVITNAFPSHFNIPFGMSKISELKKYWTPLGEEGAVKFKTKSLQGVSFCVNPQKCTVVYRMTFDSKENAQKLEKIFTDYMSDIAKVLDDKDITKFLKAQKPKIVGNSVVWEYNASWMKKNRKILEELKDAMEECSEEALKKELGEED